MPRSTGSLAPSWFRSSTVKRAFYLKMEWGGSIGTLRWTTRQVVRGGVDSRNIDGSTQNWDATKVWNVGGITEGSQTGLTISDLVFGNEANEFSDLIYLGGGIRGVPMTVWVGGFNAAAPHAFIDKFVLFKGEGERAEISNEVRVSVVPFKHPMNLRFPRRRFDSAHGFNFLPPPNLKVYWGGLPYSPPAPSANQTGNGTIDVPRDTPGSNRMRVFRVNRTRQPRVVTR